MHGKYCYSFSDDGLFCGECETIEEAVREAFDEDNGDYNDGCFVGVLKPVTWADALPMWWLDKMIESAEENLGEKLPEECFPIFYEEHIRRVHDELESAIIAKLDELLPVNKSSVEHVQRYSFVDYGLKHEEDQGHE